MDSSVCEGRCEGTCDGPCSNLANLSAPCDGVCVGGCSVEAESALCDAWRSSNDPDAVQPRQCTACSEVCILVTKASEKCLPVGVFGPTLSGPAMQALSEVAARCAALERTGEALDSLNHVVWAYHDGCFSWETDELAMQPHHLDAALESCRSLLGAGPGLHAMEA
jgi:hypothetical protein